MRKIGSWFGLESVAEGQRIVVLGIPTDARASGRAGTAAAPAAIRRWSRTAEAIDEHGRPIEGLRVRDAGDVGADDEAIRARVEELLSGSDARLLAVGGDHGVTPALLEGLSRVHAEPALVVLDAHPDLFPEYEGDRRSHACAVARAWEVGGVDPDRTALIGLRSYARPELPALERAGLVVSAADWCREGSRDVARRVAACVGPGPVYVSFDIDVLDPAAAAHLLLHAFGLWAREDRTGP